MIKLKILTDNEIAGRFRFAVNSALTFCGHVFSQLGFADVKQQWTKSRAFFGASQYLR